MAERAEQRMVERDQRAARCDLRIALEQVFDVLHDAGGKAARLKLRDELVVVERRRPRREYGVALLLRCCGWQRKTFTEPSPFGCVEQCQRDPTILPSCWIYTLVKHAILVVTRSQRSPSLRRGSNGISHLLHADLVHGGIYMTAGAGGASLLQRCGHGRRHDIRNDHIAVRHRARDDGTAIRSEEHTSELQS